MGKSLSKSAKQLQIDKTNATIVLVVSLAAVITAFSLVSIKTLISQQAYQSRVIKEQQSSLTVAKKNLESVSKLQDSYKSFNNKSNNIIGGSSAGTGPQDGSNSKIILDSLPSQYDFPALVSSVEKLLSSRGFRIESLAGTDDIALIGTTAAAAPAAAPAAIEMPFQFEVVGSYTAVNDLIAVLENSVRPVAMSTLQLKSTDTSITLTVNAKTYYQPGKTLTVTEKVVK